MASIFTKIIHGEIPCHKLYEDEHVLAFLDIMPLSVGHALVVPKEERVRLHELSPASAAALGAALQRVAKALVEATGAQDYNILQNNGVPAHQAVPHVHFHIIPKQANGKGLGLRWEPGKLSPQEGAAIAERVRGRIAAGE